MIDPWMVATFISSLIAIVLSMLLVNRNSAVKEANKREQIRRENENMKREYFKQEGMLVNAIVMSVVLHEDRKQYEVFASWRSRETGIVYNFHEICMFPMDAEQGFHPNIGGGST